MVLPCLCKSSSFFFEVQLAASLFTFITFTWERSHVSEGLSCCDVVNIKINCTIMCQITWTSYVSVWYMYYHYLHHCHHHHHHHHHHYHNPNQEKLGKKFLVTWPLTSFLHEWLDFSWEPIVSKQLVSQGARRPGCLAVLLLTTVYAFLLIYNWVCSSFKLRMKGSTSSWSFVANENTAFTECLG